MSINTGCDIITAKEVNVFKTTQKDLLHTKIIGKCFKTSSN